MGSRKASEPDLPAIGYYEVLGNSINVLADAADPYWPWTIGEVLASQEEADAVRRVWAAWFAVADEASASGGSHAPDAVLYGCRGWPDVVAAAKAAHSLLTKP